MHKNELMPYVYASAHSIRIYDSFILIIKDKLSEVVKFVATTHP